jgi:hypothetical protein
VYPYDLVERDAGDGNSKLCPDYRILGEMLVVRDSTKIWRNFLSSLLEQGRAKDI